MHKPFLGIVVLGLFTVLTPFLTRCSAAPRIEKCEAHPPTILSNGGTSLLVSVSGTKTLDLLPPTWQQLKPKKPLGKFTPPPNFFTAYFRAPEVDSDTNFALQVTVANKKSESSTCTIVVEVKKEKVKTWADIGRLLSSPDQSKQQKQGEKR